MRDGIYKNLPLRSHWRSLVRSCEREAERGETANSLATRAIQRDARLELSPGFLRGLSKIVAESADGLPGLGRLRDCEDSRDLGGMNTSLENLVLGQAKRLDGHWGNGQAPEQQAIGEALVRWGEQNLRQVEEHCLVNVGPQAKPLLKAVRQAIKAVDVAVLSKNIVTGNQPLKDSARKPIDVDLDDLRKIR